MYSETESELLKGKLAKAIRKTNYEQFMTTVKRFVDEHQSEVEWSIKDHAILLTDHGPHFNLSAWIGKGYEDNLKTIMNVVTDERRPPRYVIQAMENWLSVVLPFEIVSKVQKAAIGEWVEKYFSTEDKKKFFIFFIDYKPEGATT